MGKQGRAWESGLVGLALLTKQALQENWTYKLRGGDVGKKGPLAG